MSGIKNKSGGARDGAGRPGLYGEPTVRLTFQVPESKAADFAVKAQKILKKWLVKKKVK